MRLILTQVRELYHEGIYLKGKMAGIDEAEKEKKLGDGREETTLEKGMGKQVRGRRERGRGNREGLE